MKMNLSSIRIDGGTQPRAHIDQQAVADYAEAYRRGDKLPPLDVFYDGAEYWLADGFHRWHGARGAGLAGVDVVEHQGTRREAVLFSVGVNAAHGLRRTNEDKRKAVATLLDDPEWSGWSDNAIAKACAVSNDLVGNVRRERSTIAKESDSTFFKESEKPRVVVGADGRTQQVGKTGKAEKPKKNKPKPAKPEAPGQDDDGLLDDLNNEILKWQRENDRLNEQLRCLEQTASEPQKELAQAVKLRQLAEGARDDKMRIAHEMQKELDRLRTFRNVVREAAGAPDEKSALRWVKAMAATRAAAA